MINLILIFGFFVIVIVFLLITAWFNQKSVFYDHEGHRKYFSDIKHKYRSEDN